MSIAITIPDDAWIANDALEDPRARLLTTLEINYCSMHLEAWEVVDDPEAHTQRLTSAASEMGEDDLRDVAYAVNADGKFDTIEIAGRIYVLVATPFC